VHIDRVVKVEYPRCVGDLAVQYTGGYHDAPPLDGLAVHGGLVLVEIAAEQTMPQPGLLRADPGDLPAGLEAVVVEHADIRGGDPTRLQRLDRSLRMFRSIVHRHDCLIGHALSSPLFCRFTSSFLLGLFALHVGRR